MLTLIQHLDVIPSFKYHHKCQFPSVSCQGLHTLISHTHNLNIWMTFKWWNDIRNKYPWITYIYSYFCVSVVVQKATRCMKRRSRSLEPRATFGRSVFVPEFTRPRVHSVWNSLPQPCYDYMEYVGLCSHSSHRMPKAFQALNCIDLKLQI